MQIWDWFYFWPTQWMWKYIKDCWRTYEFLEGRPDYKWWNIIEVNKKSFNPNTLTKYIDQSLMPLSK